MKYFDSYVTRTENDFEKVKYIKRRIESRHLWAVHVVMKRKLTCDFLKNRFLVYFRDNLEFRIFFSAFTGLDAYSL